MSNYCPCFEWVLNAHRYRSVSLGYVISVIICLDSELETFACVDVCIGVYMRKCVCVCRILQSSSDGQLQTIVCVELLSGQKFLCHYKHT